MRVGIFLEMLNDNDALLITLHLKLNKQQTVKVCDATMVNSEQMPGSKKSTGILYCLLIIFAA
jgi:hypothetical protein